MRVKSNEWHLITARDTGRATCKELVAVWFTSPVQRTHGNSRRWALGGLKAGGEGRGPGRYAVREKSLTAHFWFGQVQVRRGLGRAEATNLHFSWHL